MEHVLLEFSTLSEYGVDFAFPIRATLLIYTYIVLLRRFNYR